MVGVSMIESTDVVEIITVVVIVAVSGVRADISTVVDVRV